jgi:hypothetical protein
VLLEAGQKGTRMLRLIFTICMIDTPDTCEQREMLVYEKMPAMACVMGAMPELATWRETHPNWRIARWRCEDDQTARTDVRPNGAGSSAPRAVGRYLAAPGAARIASSG